VRSSVLPVHPAGVAVHTGEYCGLHSPTPLVVRQVARLTDEVYAAAISIATKTHTSFLCVEKCKPICIAVCLIPSSHSECQIQM
jgi:hypothetical protein